jgi:hypothetical protein
MESLLMMKKTVVFVVFGLAASLALSFALAQPNPARPPGVAADAWIALSTDAGFAVTESGSNPKELGAGPYVHGYLMARRDGKWIRLAPETGGGRLTPTN